MIPTGRLFSAAGQYDSAHDGAPRIDGDRDPRAVGRGLVHGRVLILPCYVEFQSRLFRLVSGFKVRDGAFDPTIREFTITNTGIGIGNRFEGVEAVLSGMVPGGRRRGSSCYSVEGQRHRAVQLAPMSNEMLPIVEDEFAIADLLEMVLTDGGYRVMIATNGRRRRAI